MSTATPHADAGPSPAGRAAKLRLIGLFVLTDAATLAFIADWASPIRVLLVLSFLLLAPGVALTELLGIQDPVQQLALGAPMSLAVETLVAVALLYTGRFSAELAFAIVAVVTGAVLAVAGVRVWRSPERGPDSELVGLSA